jgi:hypothetical protein
MSKPDDAAKAGEIKRLLERLHELAPDPEFGASRQRLAGPPPRLPPPRQHGYYDDRAAYPGGPLAAAPAHSGQQRQRAATMGPWLFVLATALNTIVAAVLAVLITLGVVRQEPARERESRPQLAGGRGDGQPAQRVLSGSAPAVASVAVTASPPIQAVQLRPIGSPQEPLRLEAKRPARFALRIEPEEARGETFILVMTGLPAGATLSGASAIGSDAWLLGPNAATSLELTLPEWSAAVHEVAIELRLTSGAIVGRTRAWISVPPPAPAAAQKLDEAGLKEQMERAEQHLARGDVVAARALYERAAEMGSAAAAMSLAATYDPKRLWSLGVFGMIGNKERARQWYARADQLGHPDAKERLKALGD